MPVKGIQRVKRRYKAVVKEISQQRSERAVRAILSQGGAMAARMTPVDTSTLINSQYAPQIAIAAGSVRGHLGYTAEYAFFVHQAPGKLAGQPRSGKRGNYWDPGAEPGFMVKGFEKLDPQIPSLLKAIYSV